MSHTRIAAMTLMAAVLAVSGCGGSKSPSDKTSANGTESSAQAPVTQTAPSSPPLARADLIAKADAICARVNAQRSAIKLRSNRDYATKLPALAAYEQTAAAELARLTPPSSMASDWAQILTDTQTVTAYTAKIAEYARAGENRTAHLQVVAATQIQQQITALAARNGFRQCGQT